MFAAVTSFVSYRPVPVRKARLMSPEALCQIVYLAVTSGAGKESIIAFVTTATETRQDQLQVSPVLFEQLQEEMKTATSITVTRRAACPAHEMEVQQTKEQNRCLSFLLTALHMTLMMVFVLFPPWPPRIAKKLLFRAPPRGQSYHLIYGEGTDSKSTFFAREAVNQPNVRLCLPQLLTKTIDAVDVYYHLLRSHVSILNVEDDVFICAVHLSCDLTRLYLGPGGKSPLLIIFCQPNSSDLGTCLLMEPNFADIADFHGCDMLFFDYPGYGVSDGQPSEYHVYKSAEIVLEYAIKELGYKEEQIILMGFSLGTAAAIHLASITPSLGGLVLMAPFTSMLRVLFNMPNQWRSWSFDLFRSVDKAASIRCPTLVCHGTKDIISKLAHGQVIAHEIATSEMCVVDKASHQSLLGDRVMWDRVLDFVQKNFDMLAQWTRIVKNNPPT